MKCKTCVHYNMKEITLLVMICLSKLLRLDVIYVIHFCVYVKTLRKLSGLKAVHGLPFKTKFVKKGHTIFTTTNIQKETVCQIPSELSKFTKYRFPCLYNFHFFIILYLQKAFDFFVEFNSGVSGFDAAGWKTTFAGLYKKLSAKMA